MLSIHHATAKRAAEKGVTLEISHDDEGPFAIAYEGKLTVRGYNGDAPKDILSDFLALRTCNAEYPAMKATRLQDGDWQVSIGEEAFTGQRLETLVSEALDYATENEIDIDEPYEGEASEDEDDREFKTVVAPKYRIEYRARGDANHCGDWLATMLKDQFLELNPESVNARFDWRKYRDMLIENGVDMSGKWASLPESGQNHWMGRYRMNGRQKLEKIVATTGKLTMFGITHQVPEDDLIALWNRHPEAEEVFEEARRAAKEEGKKQPEKNGKRNGKKGGAK